MDIEKTLTIAAPADQVWALLLDPKVMGQCVPGMQSIDVISDVEYVSVIQVKIAFVSAKFKLKTTITEQRAPHYLRSEGTGEDASVASSLKQTSEIFLTDLPGGQTELRMKINVDVLGRLGTFGLNVMKTKADRMWDEFAVKLAARLSPTEATHAAPAVDAAPAKPVGVGVSVPVASSAPPSVRHAQPLSATHRPGWLASLFGTAQPQAAAQAAPDWPHIRVDFKRGETSATVYWPTAEAAACADWLQKMTNA